MTMRDDPMQRHGRSEILGCPSVRITRRTCRMLQVNQNAWPFPYTLKICEPELKRLKPVEYSTREGRRAVLKSPVKRNQVNSHPVQLVGATRKSQNYISPRMQGWRKHKKQIFLDRHFWNSFNENKWSPRKRASSSRRSPMQIPDVQ